ncbi:MAG: hypothetical protein CSA07_05260 [Bacteroidia bacterium]|nr:MAG: hypothetical protein CSA07_05260 [Bacteroidia bacterium]
MLGLLLVGLGLAYACGGGQTSDPQVRELEGQVDSLRRTDSLKEATLNEFFTSLAEIEKKLELVSEKERLVNADMGYIWSGDLEETKRERVAQNMEEISQLMTSNMNTIDRLGKMLQSSSIKVSHLQLMLDDMRGQLLQRDSTISMLRTHVEVLRLNIDSLSQALDSAGLANLQLANEVYEQRRQMDQAWYAHGTKKELQENGIIERKGGFLGIGRNSALKDDFNPGYFTSISIAETDFIPFVDKKNGVDVVTPHPAESYAIATNANGVSIGLQIKDKEQFWRATHFLVIVIK